MCHTSCQSVYRNKTEWNFLNAFDLPGIQKDTTWLIAMTEKDQGKIMICRFLSLLHNNKKKENSRINNNVIRTKKFVPMLS